MKKLLLLLGIAVCTIFSTFGFISSKGSLDNFVFLQNTEVKNAVVEINTNTYEFYLSTPESFDYAYIEVFNSVQTNGDYEFYYFNENKAKISINLSDYLDISSDLDFYFENDEYNAFHITNNSIGRSFFIYDTELEYWYLQYSDKTQVMGFGFNFNYSISNINQLNTELIPFIGNLTSLPEQPEEPIPPIPEPTPDSMDSSIGNVIRGIIDWFVDIFNGLADAFVIIDDSGQFLGFTIWGQVLFIEVGIGLVILVLKWVISLVRGV